MLAAAMFSTALLSFLLQCSCCCSCRDSPSMHKAAAPSMDWEAEFAQAQQNRKAALENKKKLELGVPAIIEDDAADSDNEEEAIAAPPAKPAAPPPRPSMKPVVAGLSAAGSVSKIEQKEEDVESTFQFECRIRCCLLPC